MKRRLMALLLVVATAAAGIGLYFVVASDNPQTDTDQAACSRYGMTSQIQMAPQALIEASQRTAGATQNGSSEPLGAFERRNFIDDIIADTADRDSVPLGALSSDGEFVRRIYLDITGRPATPEKAKAFIDDTNPDKRSALITQLLSSEDANARLAWYYGELLRMTNVFGQRMTHDIEVRNAYYQFVLDSVTNNKRWDVFMRELVTATGRNHPPSEFSDDPAINYIVRARRGLGDKRDAMDEMVNSTSRVFLGINTECINCHSGQRHLEEINTYLAGKKRDDLWGMSAFFSSLNFDNTSEIQGGYPSNPESQSRIRSNPPNRARRTNPPEEALDPPGNLTVIVQDDAPVPSGAQRQAYDRNGGGGIRPGRCPNPCTPDIRFVYPKYMFTDGASVVEDNYRATLADLIIADPQFARAGANTFWKYAIGIGMVEPIYAFDPAKPDQPSNPVLLDRLAQEFRNNGYDVKKLLTLIYNSSTYQMSAYWPEGRPAWQDRWSKYNVRHLMRPLEPEQAVDAIMQASNINFTFEIPGLGELHWVNQFPDTAEPQNHTAIGGSNVPNSITNLLTGARFDRGNRFSGGNPYGRQNPPVNSISKALALMNDSGFILTRLKVATNGSRSKDLYARIQADPENLVVKHEVVADIFLSTLNRRPTASEMKTGLASLEADPRAGIEDLMWVLVNSIQFHLN